jgi:hypothetical protein
MKRFSIVFLFISIGFNLWGSNKDTAFQSRINRLARLADSITYSKVQRVRWEVSNALKDSLEDIIISENSFNANYDSFKTVAVVESKDKRVRIFTWNYFNDSGFYQVQGVMQLNPKYFDEVYYELISFTGKIDSLYQTLSPDKWLPALYYDIYTYKYKRKCYYILTGFNAGNPILRYNTVECLYLEKGQLPQFGKPIFKTQSNSRMNQKRLIYIYSGQATMVCKIEPKEKYLVVSSLVPVRYKREGDRAYYAPDGTYDYFSYKKGIWSFQGILSSFGGIGNRELNGSFKTE